MAARGALVIAGHLDGSAGGYCLPSFNSFYYTPLRYEGVRQMATKKRKKTRQVKKVRKATGQRRRQRTSKSGKLKQPRKAPPAVEEPTTGDTYAALIPERKYALANATVSKMLIR